MISAYGQLGLPGQGGIGPQNWALGGWAGAYSGAFEDYPSYRWVLVTLPNTIPNLYYRRFGPLKYYYEGNYYDQIPNILRDYTPGSSYWMPTAWPNIFYNAERGQYYHAGNGKYTTTIKRSDPGAGSSAGSGYTVTGPRSTAPMAYPGGGVTYPQGISVGTASGASDWPPPGAVGEQVFVGPADVELGAGGRPGGRRRKRPGEAEAETAMSPYVAAGGTLAILGLIGTALYFVFRPKRRA